MRLFLALILFFRTLKYGLSTSADAARFVTLRRVPAGVRKSFALSVCGQSSRPMSGPLSPLYG